MRAFLFSYTRGLLPVEDTGLLGGLAVWGGQERVVVDLELT